MHQALQRLCVSSAYPHYFQTYQEQQHAASARPVCSRQALVCAYHVKMDIILYMIHRQNVLSVQQVIILRITLHYVNRASQAHTAPVHPAPALHAQPIQCLEIMPLMTTHTIYH
jgi:hypothetical protein